MPLTRGEGMTQQPHSPAPRRETGLEDDTDPLVPQAESSNEPFRFSCPEQRAPNGVAVKALRPLTRSGSARALTPDAYFNAPTRIRKLANKRKNNQPWVLTVPAPSGMNCVLVVVPAGIEPATFRV